MGRGSTQILIRKIIECLAKGPKSITEIAEDTGLDRTAIVRYLNILKESKFLTEEEKGTSKIFHLSSTYRTDTYFGLPIDRDIDNQINSLYYLIKNKWEEKTGRKLLKTTAQKIMYKVIKECNLKIPVGWYIYGGICIKPYDYNSTYDFKGLNDNIINCVNDTVVEYSRNTFEYESKQQQYKEAGKQLFDLKEDILKLLYSKNFSEKSMYVFQKLYTKFMRLTPKGDSVYEDLIEDYMTLIVDITKNWTDFVDEHNDRNFAEFKQKLISSFEALWKLIALHNFKQDLFKGNFYSQNVLDEHFKLDIVQAKEDLIEIGSELNDMIPFEEPNDPVYKQLKEMFSKAKIRTSEESERTEKEMREYRKKYGLEALNKKILKEFGLD
jgi:DNA-binding transcriptional ArsR family regulator